MLELRRALDCGVANFGWLDSRHTFSFGHYHDPKRAGFSDLLVIDDDRVQAGDGARLRDPGMLRFDGGQDAEVLLFDLRPIELPMR